MDLEGKNRPGGTPPRYSYQDRKGTKKQQKRKAIKAISYEGSEGVLVFPGERSEAISPHDLNLE